MTKSIALLRAVNVGGKNAIAMARLREIMAGLGCTDVTTLLQSGNLVFSSYATDEHALVTLLEGAIASELGLDVKVVLRAQDELEAVVAGNPFLAEKADPARLHVTFLAAHPRARSVEQLNADSFLPDECVVKGREVYLHCPHGYARTKLSNEAFERWFGVTATTRSWSTVVKLNALVHA